MVKKKKNDLEDTLVGIVIIIILVTAIFCSGLLVGGMSVDIRLSQETGDIVCQQLTNNSEAIASNEIKRDIDDGKLICTIPSYDSTQNIIVKTNDK